MNFETQVQKNFGIKPAEFAKAKAGRTATMTTQPAKPQKTVAMMAAERRRKLLRGDAVHGALRFVALTARQEKTQVPGFLSAMADRAFALQDTDFGGDDADDFDVFLADLGRFSRMRASSGSQAEVAALRGSLMDRFTKLVGTDDASDDDPDDDDDDQFYTSEAAEPNNLANPEGDSRVLGSAAAAPSPIDRNPQTKTTPGSVKSKTPAVHFAQHAAAHPSTGGLLLNIATREIALQSRRG